MHIVLEVNRSANYTFVCLGHWCYR